MALPSVLTVETDSVPGADITLVLVGQHQADGQEPDVGEVHPGLPLLSLGVRFPTVAAGGSRGNTGTQRGSHTATCRKGSSTSSTGLQPGAAQVPGVCSRTQCSPTDRALPSRRRGGAAREGREAGPPQLGLITAPSCGVLLSPTVVPLDRQRCPQGDTDWFFTEIRGLNS